MTAQLQMAESAHCETITFATTTLKEKGAEGNCDSFSLFSAINVESFTGSASQGPA